MTFGSRFAATLALISAAGLLVCWVDSRRERTESARPTTLAQAAVAEYLCGIDPPPVRFLEWRDLGVRSVGEIARGPAVRVRYLVKDPSGEIVERDLLFVVDAGDSGVSQHTRQLRRGRTSYGYYWETRDVKSHDIDPDKFTQRDYVEEIFAKQADAAEYITSHKNGAQVYFLTAGNNDKFNRVEFGDPTIVVNRQDLRDVAGNPFRVQSGLFRVMRKLNGIPWICRDTVAIAQAAYDGDRVATLALRDALLDAGCDCQEVLDHLLGPLHVRGCWVLDLVLGTE